MVTVKSWRLCPFEMQINPANQCRRRKHVAWLQKSRERIEHKNAKRSLTRSGMCRRRNEFRRVTNAAPSRVMPKDNDNPQAGPMQLLAAKFFAPVVHETFRKQTTTNFLTTSF